MDGFGVLLVNVGTPDEPTPSAVRRFLREFLSDRRVVDMRRILWWPILHLLILPLRPRIVARAYAHIWTPEGSPLLATSLRQVAALQKQLAQTLGAEIPVRIGMGYGNPSLLSALGELRDAGCTRVIMLPLYPQYSSPTVGSAGDALANALASDANLPTTRLAGPYHDAPLYIAALAAQVQRFWETNARSQHLMMSFHGLPQRYVDNGDPYQSHCQETADLLAAALKLAPEDWTITYQSRFGREKWLTPYTDATLRQWGRQGLASVDVVCPAFATDCLETLEEIAMQNRGFFQAAGGGEFHYIPALNDSPEHIVMLGSIIEDALQNWESSRKTVAE